MRVLVVALLSLAVAVGAASARPAADPGITSNEILIGGTVPLSGIAASYASVARGAEAFFKYVNARGGVNGRKIAYKYVDDQYNPSQTVQATRELVQQDRVFAVFNSLGTEHNLAVRSYLNAERCRSCSSAPARRPSGATTAATRARSASSRATSARGRSTRGTSSRRSRPRRSPSSTRTTTTARTCSAASRPGSARSGGTSWRSRATTRFRRTSRRRSRG